MLAILDLDDCLTDGRRRAALAGPEPCRTTEPEAYERWRTTIVEGLEFDEPVYAMRELARALDAAEVPTYYVTARGSSLRSKTQEWLKRHGYPSFLVLMRAEADKRKSADFKEAVISGLLTSEHEPVIVWDDDTRGELQAVCKRRGWVFNKVFI